MAALSTAERNRRKRERKKKEREDQRQQQQQQSAAAVVKQEEDDNDDVEIEYVVELPAPLADNAEFEALLKLQTIAANSVAADSDNDRRQQEQRGEDGGAAVTGDEDTDSDDGEEEDEDMMLSKRKLRDQLRPSVADLKRQVIRPDLVEAHDVTAADPQFLITLKAVPGTVPVPRHWGRKRKYLQGKRGFEKPPFQLPDFIVKTGITTVRDTVQKEEDSMNAKQKNRMRVAPKMGAMDVDYKTLHDAFFKYQTKPTGLTKLGDLYYEGKELEVKTKHLQPGGPLSRELRDALGMVSETSPPPWLINMQRYGPPPSYPSLKLPGLNAPLPTPECQYGYHPGGWGKPPVDAYGRPLYGGNPLDPPGSKPQTTMYDDWMMAGQGGGLVTSDGKTIEKSTWGVLPMAYGDDKEAEQESESEEDEDDESEMEESDEEQQHQQGDEQQAEAANGMDSVLPPPTVVPTMGGDLRKQQPAGDETPMITSTLPTKQLYQVIEQRKATSTGADGSTVFASEVAYVVPGSTAPAVDGAESVLSKAVPQTEASRRKRNNDDDDDDDLGKNFKF